MSWRSIKQSCIDDSTTEIEYVAASKAAKEAVWLRKFLQDLEVVPSAKDPIILYCDNSAAIAQAKKPQVTETRRKEVPHHQGHSAVWRNKSHQNSHNR